jgi:uncharacterized protein
MKNEYRKYAIMTAFVLIAVLAVFTSAKQSTGMCGAYENSELKFGETAVKIDISDTTCKQNLGLSGREKLEENTGMLFVFNYEGAHEMWMKDMRFPIDIIWFDSDSKITGIAQNIAPETYPSTFGGEYKAKYVLELPAGFVNKNNISLNK